MDRESTASKAVDSSSVLDCVLGAYQSGAELSKVTAKEKKLFLNLLAKNIDSCSASHRGIGPKVCDPGERCPSQ